MLWTPGNAFLFQYHNGGTNPSANPGTSVTPGATNAEGSWTQVASSANIAYDVYGICVQISGGNTSAQQKDHLLDIGIDPAGGTSYAAIISNIICGQSDASQRGAANYFFPFFIPAGSAVAVRVQGNNGTAGTVIVWCHFWGRPTRPELITVGQVSETIGTITNSGGVAFTPGNAADGTWTSLGTTTRALWWWQICAQISNGTVASERTYVDLSYGDGTTFHIIHQGHQLGFTGTTEVCSRSSVAQMVGGYREVPAGATLYVRGRCNTAPTSGYNAVAVAIG